jgi:hypothetical protein
MKTTCPSETLAEFQLTVRGYIPEDTTPHKLLCENFQVIRTKTSRKTSPWETEKRIEDNIKMCLKEMDYEAPTR